MTDGDHENIKSSLSDIITGVESPVTSFAAPSTTPEDDFTPFPSPVLSATSLAGLSLGSDGELEPEVDDNKVITEEETVEALELKALANKAFKVKNFSRSIDFYTQAIALNPKEPTFWNNRAMSKAKMEEHGGAISDATKAVELNPSYAKAFYRRGLSQLAILRPTDAVSDFKKALAIEPGNKTIRDQLAITTKLIRRIEFEKAISVGETETASQRCLSLIKSGACNLDTSSKPADMPLPIIPDDHNARYTPTKEFVEGMIESFKKGGKVPKRVAWEIILGCKAIVEKEKTLVDVVIPDGVTCDIIGDTHGQFFDVCNLLSMTTPPNEKHYMIFNGDLVDRGSWSVEVALTVFAYKWLYPEYVYINRGNHETNDMNKVYGFEGECKAKLGEMTFKLFADVFTKLPLATLVTASLPPSSPKSEGSKPAILSEGKRRFFICHGGPPVSKDGVTLDEVVKIERFGRQPGQEGIMCEMLWTDPQAQVGRGPSKRGVGLGFGPDVTRRWCELNNITAVIRSHEVRADGYAIEHDGLCITVFSCPNYCDSTGNKAAYIRMQANGTLSYHQFDAVPHPDVKPMAYSSGFSAMGF
ncbi:protein phosphatase 5 [Cryptococcus neoformans Bt1]|nr:protein phosphatase 5 [Cryptococcus neoformans var. grubii Bt1]OWZ75883.1 protein phosphatase 5 [Cryptococcus neoformans var. grubii Bt85]OXM76572.1 protein phosphatase 5 [Cryptococcus neoformans var. grubii Bt63]